MALSMYLDHYVHESVNGKYPQTSNYGYTHAKQDIVNFVINTQSSTVGRFKIPVTSPEIQLFGRCQLHQHMDMYIMKLHLMTID
jgi:hypothetical protein